MPSASTPNLSPRGNGRKPAEDPDRISSLSTDAESPVGRNQLKPPDSDPSRDVQVELDKLLAKRHYGRGVHATKAQLEIGEAELSEASVRVSPSERERAKPARRELARSHSSERGKVQASPTLSAHSSTSPTLKKDSSSTEVGVRTSPKPRPRGGLLNLHTSERAASKPLRKQASPQNSPVAKMRSRVVRDLPLTPLLETPSREATRLGGQTGRGKVHVLRVVASGSRNVCRSGYRRTRGKRLGLNGAHAADSWREVEEGGVLCLIVCPFHRFATSTDLFLHG